MTAIEHATEQWIIQAGRDGTGGQLLSLGLVRWKYWPYFFPVLEFRQENTSCNLYSNQLHRSETHLI